MTKNKENGKKVWIDSDDPPELTDEFFEMSDLWHGDKLVKKGRGRPKKSHPKKLITIRLDEDVLNSFKALGEGWQTRINNVLKEAIHKTNA